MPRRYEFLCQITGKKKKMSSKKRKINFELWWNKNNPRELQAKPGLAHVPYNLPLPSMTVQSIKTCQTLFLHIILYHLQSNRLWPIEIELTKDCWLYFDYWLRHLGRKKCIDQKYTCNLVILLYKNYLKKSATTNLKMDMIDIFDLNNRNPRIL